MRALLTALSLALVASLAHAQNTPVGLWKTIDDDGKTEKSLVRIFEEGGVVFGKIEQIFAEKDRNANCEKCKDERKGKPVLGMLIIRNLKQDSDDPALWSGGDILDPDKGEVYKTRLHPIEGGKRLEVRGYIGAPLFGRTQTWVRMQ